MSEVCMAMDHRDGQGSRRSNNLYSYCRHCLLGEFFIIRSNVVEAGLDIIILYNIIV